MKKILLDAREMEHPKPFEISMKHLRTMSDEEYLYMLNQKEPIPLLELVTDKGFVYYSHQDEDETWHIVITKNKTVELKGLLDV